jgi:NAD(P)-dependent dehydrogenase (short-subunit alcohol dehydrogenase family)
VVDANQGSAWLGLSNQVCVVTGAGSGIGAETARQLAAVGAQVAALDRNAEAVQAVAAGIVQSGGRAIAIAADVTDRAGIAAAAARVQAELGACQVLVNNAALVGYAGPLLSADLEQWNRTLEVNLTGALVCVQAFVPQMVTAGQGGAIVNVTSICGHEPLTQAGAYSVGKSGLLMLTRMLAVELAPHGIRANSVAPGLVHTPATEFAYRDAAVAEARARMVPMGRVAQPLDMADVIVFLASRRAGYVNGQDVLVDGALNQTLMALIPKPSAPPVAR